jgi:hypothetical protein
VNYSFFVGLQTVIDRFMIELVTEGEVHKNSGNRLCILSSYQILIVSIKVSEKDIADAIVIVVVVYLKSLADIEFLPLSLRNDLFRQ